MNTIAMRSGVGVTEEDLGRFGFAVSQPDGFLNHVVQRFPMGQVLGEEGQMFLADTPLSEVREIVLRGTMVANSKADLITKVDALKRWLASGDLEVSTDHDPTRHHRGRLGGAPIVAYDPAFVNRFASVAVTIVCADPFAYGNDTTSVVITSDTACALGTAISRPVITVTGIHTDLTLALKDADGGTLETMIFDLALPGATDKLVIDTARKTVRKTIGVVTSNAMNDISGGSFPTFLALNPRHGDQLLDTWPSLSASFASGVPLVVAAYPKRYR